MTPRQRQFRTMPATGGPVTDPDGLIRSYRRLLWAYPGWYRRERGREMLTTMMDAAEGQRRVTARDRLDLLLGGLRGRLRPPRGFLNRLVTALGAWLVGLAALALAGGLSAQDEPPPVGPAIATATVAMGQPPRTVPGPVERCGSFPCGGWAGDKDVARYASPPEIGPPAVEILYNHPPAQSADRLAAAARRLAGAGWTVSEPVTDATGTLTFTAVRDGITLAASGHTQAAADEWASAGGDPRASVHFVFTQAFPLRAVLGLGAAAVAGLFAGWLLTAWALQMFRRHRAGVQLAMLAVAVPALTVSVWFIWWFGVLGVGVTLEGGTPRQLLLPLDLVATMRELVLLPVASYLAAVGLAVLPRRAGAAVPVGPVGAA